MSSLLVLVPSRGRPESITRLADAFTRTCLGDTQFQLGLDSDDPALPNYPSNMNRVVKYGLRSIVPWINELAIPAAEKYDYLGLLGDDNIPRTVGWDLRIMEALKRTPFAFGNDLYPREAGSHCCHIFCRSEVVRALGYLGPPGIRHMFVDNAWMEWGKACGISYLDDVIIEHLHFTLGKSAYDDTYKAAVANWDHDNAAWAEYCAMDLATDIEKIRNVL